MWTWLGNTDSLQQTGPACYLLNPWHFESVFWINALEGIQHLGAGGLESLAGLWLAGLVSESLPVRGTCLQPKWDPPFQSEARRHCLNYPPSPAITHHQQLSTNPSSPPSQQEEGGGNTINGKRLREREIIYWGPSSRDRHSVVLRDNHVHQLGEAEQSN